MWCLVVGVTLGGRAWAGGGREVTCFAFVGVICGLLDMVFDRGGGNGRTVVVLLLLLRCVGGGGYMCCV